MFWGSGPELEWGLTLGGWWGGGSGLADVRPLGGWNQALVWFPPRSREEPRWGVSLTTRVWPTDDNNITFTGAEMGQLPTRQVDMLSAKRLTDGDPEGRHNPGDEWAMVARPPMELAPINTEVSWPVVKLSPLTVSTTRYHMGLELTGAQPSEPVLSLRQACLMMEGIHQLVNTAGNRIVQVGDGLTNVINNLEKYASENKVASDFMIQQVKILMQNSSLLRGELEEQYKWRTEATEVILRIRNFVINFDKK